MLVRAHRSDDPLCRPHRRHADRSRRQPFPSAIQDVVGELVPKASGILRVLADFPGHSTQSNLKVLVERGEGTQTEDDAALKAEVERRVRNRLSAKVDVEIVPYETFERPGVRKVVITIRERPAI